MNPKGPYQSLGGTEDSKKEPQDKAVLEKKITIFGGNLSSTRLEFAGTEINGHHMEPFRK